jgi:ATP-binding cassette subfamily F protein 3
MISFASISLMRGPQLLIDKASLAFGEGQRIGVIGRNGCGKSSLFKALTGELSLDKGEIKMPVGLRMSSMAQETPGSERSALDFVIDAHVQYRDLERRLAVAEQQGDDHALAKLHGEMELIDGYDISHRAERLLSGLGFETRQFRNPVSTFSGGWRVRLNLAAALMCPSDLLLLDEPTNHLDLEATVWLEQWLQRYQGTLLMISHDRSFLDATINQVISFEGGTLQLYKGNYSAYERLRAEKLALQQAMYEKQQRRQSEIENFVRRFRAKASKAKQAQSRLKELDRMQEIAPAHVDSPFQFRFPSLEQVPDFLMHIEDLAIGFDKPLSQKINLAVRSESRIGLLGYNGSGKSTLLKTLAGKLPSLAGKTNAARKLRIGYYAQHQVDELPIKATPVEAILAVCENPKAVSEQKIRDYLGGFDFRGARVDEPIENFSGGEKARLALARVTWQKPNLLLLDEPTNHLDLDMVHALTVALQEFEGAIIIVSHDRHLLMNTVDEFYSIHLGKFEEFRGTLNDYENWLRSNSGDEQSSAALPGSGEERVSKKHQRQQAAAKREELAPLRNLVKKCEKDIERLQRELADLETRLSDESLYEPSRKADLTELLQKQGKAKARLQEVEDEWLQAQEQLESASA